jgi:lysozyme
MDWPKLAVKLIAPYEGCHDLRKDGLVYPYLDKLAKPAVWTQGYGICYGITENSKPITKEQAMNDFEKGILAYGLKCASLAPVLLEKPPCLAAITSWAWNCGTGSFKVSRLRRAINEQRWEDAAQLVLKPDTAGGVVYKGLQKRRAAEAALFCTGINPQ